LEEGDRKGHALKTDRSATDEEEKEEERKYQSQNL
jgi:hypothetical protein